MKMVTVNILNDGRYEHFCFEGKNTDTQEFVERFRKDYNMQKSYDCLRRAFNIPFGETMLESPFVIYDEDLLTLEFMQAFKFGMHNRWDSSVNDAYDPALNPSMAGCLVTKEDLKKIQLVLASIFKLFGEKGLILAREFNLAQSIMSMQHYVPVEDSNDLYELPLMPGTATKEIVLGNEEYDPVTRCIDAFSSPIFSTYPNENVKSAVFALPQLLYVDGKFISSTQLNFLLSEISQSLTSQDMMLNNDSYREALSVCFAIYVRDNQDSFPRKGKAKQYSIADKNKF